MKVFSNIIVWRIGWDINVFKIKSDHQKRSGDKRMELENAFVAI